MDKNDFKQLIFEYYQKQGRSFPWRETHDSYAITVSEIMLQQTQTERVVPKYRTFLKELPTWQALAETSNQHLLTLWQGLGYNRRALALKRMAEAITENYQGQTPNNREGLLALPGIGAYTSGAILAFAFNTPVPIIETNIRRVYIHHFFGDATEVTDKQLMPLIEETMDKNNPREWYYALMDYGSHLAKELPNPNRKSAHYTKQSKFEGSNRQVRGALLRRATQLGGVDLKELQHMREEYGAERVKSSLAQLLQEGFLAEQGDNIVIP